MTSNASKECGEPRAQHARAPVAAHRIEFEELDVDDIDERALVRRIESEGAIAPDTWSFNFD